MADLSNTPLFPNPNGDPPNFVDPPSLTPAILGSGISLIVITTSLVILRLATNVHIAHRLYLDDSKTDPF